MEGSEEAKYKANKNKSSKIQMELRKNCFAREFDPGFWQRTGLRAKKKFKFYSFNPRMLSDEVVP